MKLSQKLLNFIHEWLDVSGYDEGNLSGFGESVGELTADLYGGNIISFRVESYFDEGLEDQYVRIFIPFPLLITNIPTPRINALRGQLVFQEGTLDDLQLGDIDSTQGLTQALIHIESVAVQVIEGYSLTVTGGRYRR